MANNSFDRTTFGLRERPVSDDFNRQASALDRSLRDVLQSMLSARSLASSTGVPYTGFIGDGFRIVPTSPLGLSVQLTPGFGFYYATGDRPTNLGAIDLSGVDDTSSYKPMLLAAPQQLAVPTAPGIGQARVDIIEVLYDRRLEDAQTRRQLDATSKAFNDHTFFKTLAFALDGRTGLVNSPSPSTAAISYKVGAAAAAGSEVEPATTIGYVKIGQINVGASVTTINNNVISDARPLLFPGGMASWSARWRLQWNGGSPIVTAKKISAPPSISVVLAVPGGSVRANATIFVMGGLLQSCPMAISVGPDIGAAIDFGASEGMMTFMRPSGATIQGGFAIGGNAAIIATGAPTVSVGAFTFGVSQEFQCRFQNNGTTNVTATILEDVDVQATGVCSWVQ